MTAIGIMGGTFDPIHFGHLRAAEEVLQGFGLKRVVFVPSGRPPHKSPSEVSSAEHRYMMAELATADNPNFEVSRIEIDREGPSYTIDTLREFRSVLGTDTKMYFITGLDAILDIHTWNDYEHLFDLAEFIAISRPGYSVESLGTLEEVIGPECFSRIHHFPVTLLAIASRDIRQMVSQGKSIRYLVPESVRLYVEKGGLYIEGDKKKFWLPGCID
ncbi:MAG TPA: nicotinate-nucleotide adenylyltransferase [Bacillota bacterium]|nr:nicotinate-nucleotide adenylyltransferase [Bacillota bacterium]HOK64397.1 nicotinate-nucleotide adenylyltransferase [Bacillota bacterium]HOL11998.1 nicotinate-nucleotide adenylyltransferase [Bacillota bacterium]HOQ02963.1 nicotinate-nucleotide adenylyltransferase [Bacillota bacterium]HPP60557.1 nicotinate-nucleotide adenylyltransferase [Bacillota bacterium]